MLSKFDPKAILEIGGGEGGPGGGSTANGAKLLSEAEVAAAMRAAEDEGDAQAAAALEKETAAEMAEFTQVRLG